MTLAWFLPPNGSLTVTGLDNRLTRAFFILAAVVGNSIVVEPRPSAILLLQGEVREWHFAVVALCG